MIGSFWTCTNKQRISVYVYVCVAVLACKCASVCVCVYALLGCKRLQCVRWVLNMCMLMLHVFIHKFA